MTQSLVGQPLQTFLDALASAEPVPGGGSVAALSGALAASLLAMVCRLTIGKKGYESVGAEMQDLLKHVEPLEREFRELMQNDIDAYAGVMQAYGLSKATEAEKSARTGAIQTALKHASDIPLQVAERCATVLDLAVPIARAGNKNAASDAGVGALMATAGLRGAALNVTINLAGIKDEAFNAARRRRVNDLIAHAARRQNEVLTIVEGRM